MRCSTVHARLGLGAGIALGALLLLLPLAAGCRGTVVVQGKGGPPPHAGRGGPPPHAKAHGRRAQGQVVVIKKGHVHSAGCGHYKHGSQWYVLSGHTHAGGCGHKFVGGIWVVAD